MADPVPDAPRPQRYGWLACIVGGVMLLHLALIGLAISPYESLRPALMGLAMVGIGLALKTVDDGLWRFQQWLTK